MTQFSSIACTCAAQWKMWLIKVFAVIYFCAFCAAQHIDTTTVGTQLSKAAPTEPPTPSLERLSTWENVFPSEKVEFKCTVPGSTDWTFTWSRDEKEVQDSDPNVSLSPEGSMLTITAASPVYSGNYICKGHHKTNGVSTAASQPSKLIVSASKPTLTVQSFDKKFLGESVTFTCKADVPSEWEYIWYHNGTEVNASSTYVINHIDHPASGEYVCKAKRGKEPSYTVESKTTLLVSEPPKPTLKLLSPWTDVFEDETVEFKCEVDSNENWIVIWYKNQEPLQENLDFIFDEESFNTFNITPMARAYQGGYACKVSLKSRNVISGFSNTINVTVYDNIPKPTIRKDPGFNQMYTGETVIFTCSVDVSSGWEYQWYRDGNYFPGTNQKIPLDLSKKGKYSCTAKRRETSTFMSDEIQQDVLEIPVPSLTLTTPWSDVFPTESVKLGCGMDNRSDWTYTWYRDGQVVLADKTVSFDSDAATLSISSASALHRGQYSCSGGLKNRSVSSGNSSRLTLNVYDNTPTVTLTQDPDYKLMFPGESVSFSCHINVTTEWEYLWYKDNSPISVPSNIYTISAVGTTHRGSYKCGAKRGINQVFQTSFSSAIRLEVGDKKPTPMMTQQPDDDKMYTGETLSFHCKVELSSHWDYFWYKDGHKLPVSGSSFNIPNASSSSNGMYKCIAQRSNTNYSTEESKERVLRISEIPVPSLTLTTPWSDVFPTESVKLGCGMDNSSDWTYTWYRDGQMVLADKTVSFDSDAATLSISSASALHHGQYSCSGSLKRRSVISGNSPGLTLQVYDKVPQATLIQDPDYNVMHTEDSVSFSCHVNMSSGWEYLWYKDNSPLEESRNNHTISSVLTKNTGSYKCQTKRGRNSVFYSSQSQAVRLDVKERLKAAIILLTGWSEVFSTDQLVLKCGVQESQDMWNYTWFKEDQPIDQPPSEKHVVTKQDDQSQYTCRGIRTERPFYSKHSDHFTTKNLLLKRRVLLAVSGFILCCIIVVFLGCIFLRFFRKPARSEYKPDEADLFLSMAQLKDRDDAPCPLVQYITDAALNSSCKEGDENGTICSETAPLPITSQEEQAETTESQNATENGGGLASFKQ